MTDRVRPGRGGDEDGPEAAWYDEDAGPVVPAYVMTGGRTRPARGQLDLISLVVVRPGATPDPAVLQPEQIQMLRLCRRPNSVAEIGAGLNLPVGTVRVLIGDLLQAGFVETQEPPLLTDLPSEELLEKVLAGLRAL